MLLSEHQLAILLPQIEEIPPYPYSVETTKVLLRQYRAIDQLIDMYLSSEEALRAKLISVTSQCINSFHSYSQWMSGHSVRQNDPQIVLRGLIALALDDLRNDYRDTLVILSLLANSARKLQGTEDIQFRLAMAVSSPKFSKFLEDYLNRPAWNRNISVMGYHETGEGDSFNYLPDNY